VYYQKRNRFQVTDAVKFHRLLRLGEIERSEKQKREQPKFSIHSRALFTAMDMPQRRADENQYFVARKAVERDDSTTGAVSDLIRVAGDVSD
jgi:hypothetical protein